MCFQLQAPAAASAPAPIAASAANEALTVAKGRLIRAQKETKGMRAGTRARAEAEKYEAQLVAQVAELEGK
jgi:hypothetical protein